jgi:hypothetical protein
MVNRIAQFANRSVSARTLRAGLACLVIATVGAWMLPDDVRRVPRPISAFENPNVAEGAAWRQGRADLPQRVGEIVTVDGRHYNVYPPLVSIVAALFDPFTAHIVPVWWSAMLLGVALPALALATFARATGSIGWGMVLALVYLFGSPMLPVAIHVFRGGLVYHVNQAYSQIGLMMLLFEMIGRRRTWVMGAGLIAASWARQTMVLYAPLVLWLAWRGRPIDAAETRHPRTRSVMSALACIAVAVGGLMIVNAVRFGNPFETGYARLEVLRGSGFGPPIHPDATGPFSSHYVPRNLYYMHVAPPHATIAHGRLIYAGNNYGTSVWLTMPILIYVLFESRRILRDSPRLALLLSALAVMAVQMAYFNTGYAQRGYSRFALDFLPALLVLIGPGVAAGPRRFITPVLAAWSLVYFGWLTHQ